MIWSKKHKCELTLIDYISVLASEIQELREELLMDFTKFDASLTKMGTDLTAEVAAAKAAILAAQANPADVTHLADAVTSLDKIDAALNAATVEFTGTATATDTNPPPPPPPAV